MTSVQSVIGLLQGGVVPNVADLKDEEEVQLPANGTAATATFFRLRRLSQAFNCVINPPTGLDFPGARVVLLLINNTGDPLDESTEFAGSIINGGASLSQVLDGQQAFFQMVFDGTSWTVYAIAGNTPVPVVRVPTLYDGPGTSVHSVSPNCVGLVDIEAWAGGGSGGEDGATNCGAGGGYAISIAQQVIPSTTQLEVVVGAGGARNPVNTDGLPGESSVVSDLAGPTVLCEASGGGGGIGVPPYAQGGMMIVGTIGVAGGAALGQTPVSGVRSGGAGGNGGAGGVAVATALGGNPVQPGGGGATDASVGQAGANGRVIVWEYQLVFV